MAKVSKRLATDEGLQKIADAIQNTEAVRQAKQEIQAEGATQVANVQVAAQTITGKADQIDQNTADIRALSEDLGDLDSRSSESITEISKYVGFEVFDTEWEKGGIYDANGENNDSVSQLNIRSRTKDHIRADREISVSVEDGWGVVLFRYNVDKIFVSKQNYTSTSQLNFANCYYFRLAAYRTGDLEITSLDGLKFSYVGIAPLIDRVGSCEDNIKTLFVRTDEKPTGEKDVVENFELTGGTGAAYTTGQVLDTPAFANYSASEFIRVYDDTIIAYRLLAPKTTAIIGQYNENKEYVGGIEGTGSTVSGEYICQNGYVRITFKTDRIEDRRVYATIIYSNTLKIGMLGDSVTWGRIGGASGVQQTAKGIPYWVGEITGSAVDNLGVGSMGWISHQYIATNAMEYVRTLDFSKYDFVTLAWGLNDGDIALGAYTDTDGTTIMGAVFDVCNYIMTQNPKTRLVLIAPTVGKGSAFPYYNPNGQHTASDHWRFTDYFEEIKLFSEKYSIPLIMGNYCLNAWNRNLYIGDNVHPTEEGYKVVGRYIANQIEKYL